MAGPDTQNVDEPSRDEGRWQERNITFTPYNDRLFHTNNSFLIIYIFFRRTNEGSVLRHMKSYQYRTHECICAIESSMIIYICSYEMKRKT